jgi:molybdopterin biosynthesis enzyme MoaB
VELQLFEKTEVWIKPLHIQEVNLSLVAEKVAEVLNLRKSEVLVVDVREDTIVLDIIRKTVQAQDIVGKGEALLKALATVPGVSLRSDTAVHSEGVLGLIDVDSGEAGNLIEKMEHLERQISDRISRRAIIFPSGFEVKQGLIQDTNSPYIKERLAQEGFFVTLGDVLEDNLEDIAFALSRAVSQGFGLIITTGGVGAEQKDRMVEALLKLDPRAATPYIIRYEKGKGRHEKDGVKIGVAYVKPSLLVALPGPHEEVKIGVDVILDGLKKGQTKEDLALSLAEKYIATLKQIHHAP